MVLYGKMEYSNQFEEIPSELKSHLSFVDDKAVINAGCLEGKYCDISIKRSDRKSALKRSHASFKVLR